MGGPEMAPHTLQHPERPAEPGCSSIIGPQRLHHATVAEGAEVVAGQAEAAAVDFLVVGADCDRAGALDAARAGGEPRDDTDHREQPAERARELEDVVARADRGSAKSSRTLATGPQGTSAASSRARTSGASAAPTQAWTSPSSSSRRATRAAIVGNSAASSGRSMAAAKRSNIRSLVHAIATQRPSRPR